MGWQETDESLIRYARQVRVAGFNDCHTIDGHFLQLGVAQDGAEPPCTGCGLRLAATVRPSAHKIGCPNYSPHPDSIVAWVANYNTCHTPEGYNTPSGSELTITYINNHGA